MVRVDEYFDVLLGTNLELVNKELAPPESEIMRELYYYFYLAQEFEQAGNLTKAKKFHKKILKLNLLIRNQLAISLCNHYLLFL